MARRNRRKDLDTGKPVAGDLSLQRRVSKSDGDWIMRRVSGVNATKAYTCPWCNQAISQGTPHVVAWQDGWSTGVDARRHWHSSCWTSHERQR
ncbi:MAG: hypothetical protein WBB44_05525 [Candidatus Nanopelagicales bacterium]|nr:hypothetical protein [Candidatus Nanopelagicales bacterium]